MLAKVDSERIVGKKGKYHCLFLKAESFMSFPIEKKKHKREGHESLGFND